MEFGKFEKSVAILGSTLTLAIGVSACKNDDPIRVPTSAQELGTVNNEGASTNGYDLGFLFEEENSADAGLVDCTDHAREVTVFESGEVQVVCADADDDGVIRFAP